MNPAIRPRVRQAMPAALLAAVIYVPLLLTAPGRISADTKSYLYLDPGRMLARAVSMWDPNIGMGTVTHQNIGYLWPIGPYYWLAQTAGLPDWVAQRIWLGSIMFLAGLGVRYLLGVIGQRGPQVTAASFVYALTPYVLTLAARISVILLPYAGLPWLIAFTVLALRRGGWRYPALFALTVATIGSINATALVLAGMGPLLWILHALLIAREVRWRQATAAVARIGALTVGCSLWWMSGLYAQSAYGIDILRFTETAATVATASMAPELLRGLGYWFFYGEDRFGPWIAPSKTYTQKIWVLVVTYLLPILGLIGAAIARFRDRAFFVALVVTGVFLAVGGHPWDAPPPAGRVFKAFLLSDTGLAMRSLPRAAPLIVLGLAVLLGSGLAAITAERKRWGRPAAAGVMVLAVLGLPPLWTGGMVDQNLDRAEAIPAYWRDDARYLDRRSHDTRVLEVPGADFASYRWGTTVDPITPGLMDRPFVARELIPYGSAASADLLNAFDRQMQEGTLDPRAVSPMARFMAVGDINVRSDLTFERYNTPRPRNLWDLLTRAPGLGPATGFGGNARNIPRASLPLRDETDLLIAPTLPDPPQVAAIAVRQPEKIVRLAPADRPVVMAGDGEGMVNASAAGLLTGHELVQYSASMAGDPQGVRRLVDDHAALVLTDTNRRQARRWSTLRENLGLTERAGQTPLRTDPRDQRLDLFPAADDDAFTVTESLGDVWAEATSYGNGVTYTPEDRPANAADGEPTTSWRAGGFQQVEGESIRLHYRTPVTTDRLNFQQVLGGVRNRYITEVAVRFDGGRPINLRLDEKSRNEPGQTVTIGKTRTFRTLDVEITADDVGRRARYDGLSPVGFSEINVTPGRPQPPRVNDAIRLPVDLLNAAGRRSLGNPLSVVLTRNRSIGSNAVRTDEERSLVRSLAVPTARSFGLVGRARLSNAAADDVIDRVLGAPDAAHGGIVATSKRRLPGGLANRASAAIDGDASTWYSPGFLGQNGEQLRYQLAAPITFDHLDLTLLNDGRHSVPRRLAISSGGQVVARVRVPDIADQATPNGQAAVHVQFPPVTGRDLTFAVDDGPDAVREVTTIDWYSGQTVVMPIGVVELGVPGLRVLAPSGPIDPRCRGGLLSVDGRDVGLSLRGTVADLQAGRAVSVHTCDDGALPLPVGHTVLQAVPGVNTGIDLDQLVLRSAAGGAADRSEGAVPAAPQPAAPRPEVVHSGRTTLDVDVPTGGRGGWLVLGQSHNLGWTATAAGHDLGPPALVNGYANGWRLPSGRGPIRVHLEWTPQNVVWGALALSALTVLVSLALILLPRRRRLPAHDQIDERRRADAESGMPNPFRLGRLLRYSGPRPTIGTTSIAVAATLVVSWAVIGPAAGLALAVVTALALRAPRSRPLLTVGSPALLALSAAYIIARQIRRRLPSGFDWPTYFESVHQVAWAAVALLVLDVIIDRLWLRAWWPSDDS